MAGPTFALQISDSDIISKLTLFEDSFVERKTIGDSRDWLKTVVAFANSAPVGFPALLFIGVRNDGSIEGTANLDSLQQSFTRRLGDAYPPIYCWQKVLSKDGKQFLAVIIPGSPDRPHFAGPSFVRLGSESVIASEQQFTELITWRHDKARHILQWKNKEITVHVLHVEHVMHSLGRVSSTDARIVRDCNPFYVILEMGQTLFSYSLRRIDLSFDNEKGRLAIEVRPA